LDLIQFGRTCSDLRSAMGYVVRQRFRSIMAVFVRDFLPAFVQVLDRSGGVITGSCAIKMLLGVEFTIQSRDLNLIVPCGGFETMNDFILRILSFESIPGVVHPVLSPLINRYHAYLHQGCIVTLTEVKKDKGVLHVILSGASTSDMIFMTSGGLTSFFSRSDREGIDCVDPCRRSSPRRCR